MRNNCKVLFVLLVMVSSVTNAEQRFPVRLDRNYDIPGARGDEHYTMNHSNVVNNYDFAPDPEGIKGEGREAFLKKTANNRTAMAKRAAELKAMGVKNYLYTSEINPRGTNADLSTPAKRFEFIENKYYEMSTLCPWLDGIFMQISETPIPARTLEEVKGYFLAAYRGLDRANQEDGKERVLFAHTYLSNSRTNNITDYYPITDDSEIAKKIYLVSRHGHGDTNMKTPINPLIGNEGAHPHILIFSLTGGEYKCLDWYPCGMAHDWSARFKQLAKFPNVVGLQVWGSRSVSKFEKEVGYFKDRNSSGPSMWAASNFKWTPWAHLCAYTFHSLAKDPYKDPRQIYIDWATEHYGKAAAEPLADILTISSDVVFTALPPAHSAYLSSRPSFVFSPLEYHLPIDAKGANPNVGEIIYNINAVDIEGKQQYFDQAMVKADTMLAILDGHKSGFATDDYRRIRDDLVGLRNLLEVNTIVYMGAHRYIYWQNLKGKQRQQQVDIVAGLVERGFELQGDPEFLCQKPLTTHPRYETDYEIVGERICTGDTSYMPCLRELDAVVKAERKGDYLRILPEKVEEAFNLPFKPKEITCVNDNLYILGEDNSIHKYSTSGKEIGSSRKLATEVTALANDSQGNLLLVIDRDIYKLPVSDIANAEPVKWRPIPDYIKKPGALAYDSQTGRLFIGDNKDFRIVQIGPDGKEQGDTLVPYNKISPWDNIRQIRGFDFHEGYLYSVESYTERPHIIVTRGVFKLKKYAPVKIEDMKVITDNISFIFAEHLDAITNMSNPQKEFCYQATDKPYYTKDDLWGIHPPKEGRPASLTSSREKAPELKITIPVSKPGEYELYLKTAYSTKYSLDGKKWDSCNGTKRIGLVTVKQDTFELYIDGDTAGNKSGCYIISAELKSPDRKLKHLDDWQLAMMGGFARDIDWSEDVCFDGKSNAWFIRPARVRQNEPLPDMLYRVKLQGGTNYKPNVK